MALDSFFISALARELNFELTGQKIIKIHMPEKNKIIFQLYGKEGGRRLLISAGAGNARIYFTESDFENPSEPPMFCMLLRKYLNGAVITGVRQTGHDRILDIALTGRDALGDTENYRIVVEMLGNSSNLILLDADERIIDALIRSGYKNDFSRCINPGAFYTPPPVQEKTDIFKADEEDIILMCEKADPDIQVSEWLLSQFLGFSPMLCRELAYRATYSYNQLPDVISAFKKQCETGEFLPYIYVKDGRFSELSSYRLSHLEKNCEEILSDSFSEAIRLFYSEREADERKKNLSGALLKQVRNIRNRISKKLSSQTDQLKSTENADEIRKSAEFIIANIYRIKKGDSLLKCPDYYSDDQREIEIELDPLKTPQQNASALFKEYNKKKKAAVIISEMLEKERLELEYLDSVSEEIRRAESAADIAEIKSELTGAGFIREHAKAEKRSAKISGPLIFETFAGEKIYVGRNNLQNDALTFRQARRTDYWFHVKAYHGSHVILSASGSEPSEESIISAAAYAVKYSEASGSGKQAVDYTQVSNVSKPAGAYPGRVIYKNYKTVIVSDEEIKK